MVEARVYEKLGVSESNVKLKLSYTPLLVGCDEKCAICDDEDLCGYLLSLDKENRRCILFVEVIKRSELPEQLSRAGKRSSLGMNYEVWHSNDDEIGDKAITLYGGDNQFDKQPEGGIVAIEEVSEKGDEEVNVDSNVDDNVDSNVDGNGDNGRQDTEMRDRYVDVPHVAKQVQFMEEWEDGLGLKIQQEFASKKVVQEVVDRGACKKTLGLMWSNPIRSD